MQIFPESGNAEIQIFSVPNVFRRREAPPKLLSGSQRHAYQIRRYDQPGRARARIFRGHRRNQHQSVAVDHPPAERRLVAADGEARRRRADDLAKAGAERIPRILEDDEVPSR